MRTRKGILITLMAMAMLYMAMSLQAFAADAGYLTDTLTLTDSEDASGTGYIWNSTTKTLTITQAGLTIKTTDLYHKGIVVPEGSTIIINGELTIDSSYYGIYCTGNLTIKANADADISSDGYEAIRVEGGVLDLMVNTGVTMDVSGYTAIYAYSGEADTTYVKITADGDLNLNGSSRGIESLGRVILMGTGNIYIYGSTTPIEAGADICVGSDDSTISVTFGSILPSKYSSNLSIGNSATLNGLVSYTDKDIVYGEYTVTNSLTLLGNGVNTLEFSAGSTLTINEDVYIYLTSYASVDYTNANIINNGNLELSTDVSDIGALNINGNGKIEVVGNDGLSYYYDNNGTFLYVGGDITLGNAEVTSSSLYKWTKDADDVYTLELFSGIDYDEISFYIEVGSAIIDLNDDVEVYAIELNGDYGVELSISGDFTLTCSDEISGEGILTIEEGSTLVSPYIELSAYRPEENAVRVLSLLVVSGTLKSNYLFIGDFEVTNTGAVYLSSEEESTFISYNAIGIEPTVTLGDQIKIISPEGAYYSVEEFQYRYYGCFYTSEGDAVSELYIGAKPYYDITVTITGEGSVSPDGDTVSVMEGFDKEFTFTPADGYEISNVIINGESWGAIEGYTFEDVVEDYTLEVEFTAIESGDGDSNTSDNESAAPATGDSANAALYVVIMMLGICGIVVVGYKRIQN